MQVLMMYTCRLMLEVDVLPAAFFLGPPNVFYEARKTAIESTQVERSVI